MTQPTGRGSLFDNAVARFHDLVLADAHLAPWFAGMDPAQVQDHQAELLGSALEGGTSRFDLRRAHAGLSIDDAAHDRIAAHLVAALAAVGIDDGHLRDVRQVVAGLRDQVVEA